MGILDQIKAIMATEKRLVVVLATMSHDENGCPQWALRRLALVVAHHLPV